MRVTGIACGPFAAPFLTLSSTVLWQVDRLERSCSGPLPTHHSRGHEPPAPYDAFPWWVVAVPVVGLCVCALSTWAGGRGRPPSRQPRERKSAPRAKTQQWSQFSAFKS